MGRLHHQGQKACYLQVVGWSWLQVLRMGWQRRDVPFGHKADYLVPASRVASLGPAGSDAALTLRGGATAGGL